MQDPLKGLRLANHTASFDLDANPTKNFLRADPVHLRADKNRVYLFDYTSFELTRDEALEIVSKLNKFLNLTALSFMWESVLIVGMQKVSIHFQSTCRHLQ